MALEEKLYSVGKGKVLFKQTGQTNFRGLGNAPVFSVTEKVDVLEHFSSEEGMNTKDKKKVKQIAATVALTLDELLDENLKMWILSSSITDVVQTQGTTSAQAITAELDVWIDLGKKKLSSVVVKAETPSAWEDANAYTLGEIVLAGTYRAECTVAGTSGGTEPTWAGKVPGDTVADGSGALEWTIRKLTYAVNTDYRLDTEVGLLMPLSTGDIEAAQALKVDSTHAAITIKRLDAANVSAIEGDLWFVGNPPVGKIIDVKGYVSILPKGDLTMITDKWMDMQFDVEFLSGYGYNGLFELHKRGVVE